MRQSRQYISLSDAKSPLFVGVDLGGTSTKLGVIDEEGRALCRHAFPTQVDRGPEEAATRLASAIGNALAQLGIDPTAIARVGLGSPGILDVRRGIMVNPTNFPGWNQFPLRDRVSCHCGMPVTFVNDANAAAYGEFWVGSGREFQSLILLTLGTGVGCGIIIGDVIVEGENGHGAECGHVLIDSSPTARRCSCGMTGHLEAYASATAVTLRARAAIDAGEPTSLVKRVRGGDTLTPRLVAEEAGAGDPLSNQIVLETTRYLGVGIVSLLHTIDPAGVLLGGAMTFGGNDRELGQRFLAAVAEEIKGRTFPTLAERLQVRFASLGTDAGYIGAAGIARLEHYKSLRQPPVWP